MNKPTNKLGFDQNEAKTVADALNQILANEHVHYQKLRSFHWNVTGGDFFDLHDRFEAHYNEALLRIDEIAERIRVFGFTPLSTLKAYLEASDIQEVGTELAGEEMAEEILQDFEILLSYYADAIHEAAEIGDVGTVDMLNGFARSLEKNHWMLRAFLGRR